jgi:hypothetical protein
MGLIDSAVPYASAFVTDSHYHANLLQRMLKVGLALDVSTIKHLTGLINSSEL